MTIEEATSELERILNYGYLSEYGKFVLPNCEAIEMALAALRAQQEAEKNEPLTLEELRRMDGQPVYVTMNGYEDFWALAYCYWKAERVIYLTYSNGSSSLVEFMLNSGAKIYRRPPVGEGR